MCNKHVHSTVTRSSRFHCLIGVINKPTTVELCISPVYRRLAVAKFSKSTMQKLLTWPWPSPLREHSLITRLRLRMADPCTKFEVSSISRSGICKQLLFSGTLSQSQHDKRRQLNSTDDCCHFITLSVHLCVQHDGCDAAWQLRLVNSHKQAFFARRHFCKGLVTAREWTVLTWTSRPSYMTRSLVTRVSVTTILRTDWLKRN